MAFPAVLATFVCVACQTRKKACDKKLPRCSYCESRSLECQYPPFPPSKKKEVMPFMIQTPSEPGQSSQGLLNRNIHDSLFSVVDELDASISRYFNGLHLWLPFLSQSTFRARLHDSTGTTDFELLTLVICLVGRVPTPSVPRQDDLYIAIKSHLAQLQIFEQTSIDLITATTLVSMYEYACRICNAALVTLSTAIRMAYELGIDQKSASTPSNMQDAERLWWVLAILERLYTLDSRNPYQSIMTTLSSPVPSEPDTPPSTSHQQSLATDDLAGNKSIYIAVQASILLEKVLMINRHRSQSGHSSHYVTTLDAELRELLRVVLDRCEGMYSTTCGSIAIVLRAIFALHKASVYPTSLAPALDTETSTNAFTAALDTATTIMVDFATLHVGRVSTENISAFSPTCVYIINEALEHVKRSGTRAHCSLEPMVSFLKIYHQRWRIDIRKVC